MSSAPFMLLKQEKLVFLFFFRILWHFPDLDIIFCLQIVIVLVFQIIFLGFFWEAFFPSEVTTI